MAVSDFRVEIKKSFQAGFQLFLDLIFAALKDVHGDVGFAAIFQLQRSVTHLFNLFGRKQSQSVN